MKKMNATKWYSMNISRLLAYILSIALLITSLPLGIFAVSFPTVSSENTTTPAIDRYTYELIDRRDEYTKHFRNPDGTTTAVTFTDPVHRPTEDGSWEPIDNTLVASANDYATQDARIKFAKKTTGNAVLFTLHDGNYKITMSLNGANKKIYGNVTNYESAEGDDEITKLSQLNKLNAAIRYNGILDGVDLEYIAVSNSIKENIIVNTPLSDYSFSFTVKLNNLTAEAVTDGSILLKNEAGDTVYRIAAPYMYDAAGADSQAVRYTLSPNGNKEYTLTVTADPTWIHADDRVFPVTIDPSVSPSDETALDLEMPYASPNPNQSTSNMMRSGTNYRAYWKTTTLPTLPFYYYITSATFSLYQANSGSAHIGIHRVTADWTSTLVYNNTVDTTAPKGTIDSEVLDYQETNTGGQPYSWNITELVRGWYDGSYENYGVSLQRVAETGTGDVSFYTNEHTVVSQRPRLMITYKDPFGLEEYWSYFSHDAGIAGTANINLANGFLTLNVGTLTTTDSLMPFTPTVIYHAGLNSWLNTCYNREVPYKFATIGGGWTTNMSVSLVPRTRINEEGAEETYYIYCDADGTHHCFYPGPEESGNVYYDEDGLQLTLTVNEDNYVLTDAAYNTYTFYKQNEANNYLAAGGFLQSITDVNGNSLSFSSNSYGRPQNVTLTPNGESAITQLNIVYSSLGVIRYFVNHATDQAVFLFYSDTVDGALGNYYRQLRRIVFAHGTNDTTATEWATFYSYYCTNKAADPDGEIVIDAVSEYDYDSAKRVSRVYDGFHQMEYTYTYDEANRVTAIRQKGGTTSQLVEGQYVTFTYGNGYTDVRSVGSDDTYGTDDDIVTRYLFDHEARCINRYSMDINGFMIYGASQVDYTEDEGKAKNRVAQSSVISDLGTNYLVNSNFDLGGQTSLQYWTVSGTVTPDDTAPAYNGFSYDSPFNVKLMSGSSLTQHVLLYGGTYTLSADALYTWGNDVTVRLKVQSLSDASVVYTEEFAHRKELSLGEEVQGSLTFEVPGTGWTTQRYAVSIEVIGDETTTSQFVWLSRISLTKSIGAGLVSRVNYGNFESSAMNGTTPYPVSTFWSNPAGNAVFTVANDLPLGNSLYLLGKGVTADNYVVQTLFEASEEAKQQFIAGGSNSLLIPAKQYRLSGRAKSDGAMPNAESTFGISLEITELYFENDELCQLTRTERLLFNPYCDTWQYVSGIVSTTEGRFVVSIKVQCENNKQLNGANFDDISVCYLFSDNSPDTYEYDDNGNLIMAGNGYDAVWYQYDNTDVNKVIRTITHRRITEYQYDTANTKRLASVNTYYFSGNVNEAYYGYTDTTTKTLRTTETYTYNAYGQVIQTGTAAADQLAAAVTVNTFHGTDAPRIFGALKSSSDGFGRTTQYFYEESKGYLLATVAADGNGMYYTYDALGRMIQAQPAVIATDGSASPVIGSAQAVYQYNTAGQLQSITTANNTYAFSYDVFGNRTAVTEAGFPLARYTYRENNGKLDTVTYGYGTTVKYEYDTLDRIKEIWYKESGETAYTKGYSYEYTSDGSLYQLTDYISGQITTYKHDNNGRLKEYYVNAIGTIDGQSMFYNTYDDEGRITGQHYRKDYTYSGDRCVAAVNLSVGYQDDGNVNMVSLSTTDDIDYTNNYWYDYFGRTTRKVTALSCTKTTPITGYSIDDTYTYETVDGATSGRITAIASTLKNGGAEETDTYAYTYDAVGRITAVSVNSETQYSYQYDALGQLVRENNKPLNQTVLYTYDNNANLLSKTVYAYTTAATVSGTPTDSVTYAYTILNRRNLLTAYDGETITYDVIGNPLTYRGMTMTWTQGRRLTTLTDGTQSLSYTYNDEGIRTSKTVNGIKHTYTVSGSRILSEEWTENGLDHLILYIYDATGSPIGMQYRNSGYVADWFDSYLYRKNLQGDVIGVYDESGTLLVSYTYDAWGNQTVTYSNGGASTAARYNPFRYRGYFYDTETGLYYLNSRYYDPETGRFINADAYISTGQGLTGNNMFAYCGNDPINRKDLNGQGWITALIITAVVIVVATVSVKIGADIIIEKSGANDAEKALAKKDYIAAYQVNQAKQTTEEYIDKTYGKENDIDGTQVNAYRHAMWNAIMTDMIGEKKAKKFADAHEQFPNNPIEHMEMDLHNNELGRRIAIEYAGQGYDVFSQKIQEAINNGEAKVIIWDPNVN